MKSKSGTWHKVSSDKPFINGTGKIVPCCQSHNLKRLNELQGEQVEKMPTTGMICRKCFSLL
jgi:hypothetical protein